MRYALISDVHGNLEALQVVLHHIEKEHPDKLVCLGDLVGYGADPQKCIDMVRERTELVVAGNHDWAAIGKLDTADFNPDAATACHWTAYQLSPEDIHYLESLPPVIERDDFTLVHGSPREPIWEYIVSTVSARQNFDYFQSQYCLIGHSHIPLAFEYSQGTCLYSELPADSVLGLAENRLIVNPGSVGQPRDGDPRASYAIYDSEASAIYHYRISYDIGATQSRMMEYGLPKRLVTRLSYGV